MTTLENLTAPIGMAGLACEPWSKGEIYAVAADWSQAGSPVMVYGRNKWDYISSGLQVAFFRHNDRAALEYVIREAIVAGGDEPDDDDVESILDRAIDISDE